MEGGLKMNKRKTIKIEELKKFINKKLSLKTIDISEKRTACFILEHYLFKTKNYEGYMFLNNNYSDINTIGYYERKYF